MWLPTEEAQFAHVCARCGKRIRRWYGRGWQGYDGLFTCFRGRVPVKNDLGHRHTPTDAVYDRRG